MKYLLLAFLWAIAPLHADDANSTAKWQQVLLFDWLYPGEEGYTTLKTAAMEAGSTDWLVARMDRGDKLPEASARELAYTLEQDSAVSPELKKKLNSIFADEPDLLRDTGTASAASKLADLSTQMDSMDKKMDDIESIFNGNRYGKGGFPATDIGVWSGYELFSPAGFMQNATHGFAEGGMAITFRGTIDKATYSLTVGQEYIGTDPNGTNAAFDYSSQIGYMGDAFSFMIPLDQGGLEIHLGEEVPENLSSLIYSTIDLANANNFFVDVSQAYRPASTINAANLSYPDQSILKEGVTINKQGAVWYWPFTNTQLVYSTYENQYFETFDAKLNQIGFRLDEDLGPRWDFIDDFLLYGTLSDVFRDPDELFTTGEAIVDEESDHAYAVGTDLELGSGASLKGEFAVSDFQRDYGSIYDENAQGSAWIADLTVPVGPIHVAFENGMASPNFITRDRYENAEVGGETDRFQAGATLDSTMGAVQPMESPTDPGVTGSTVPGMETTTWVSMVKDPSILSNNTYRNVLKMEWHGSWTSLGLYDGVISQINPSGPFVLTSPYIEGSAANGAGWFQAFGQQYGYAALSDPGEPVAVGGGAQSVQGEHFQYLFNGPTTANAFYKGTALGPMHYAEISQQSYDEAEFTLALTQKGVGDDNLMDDSIKTLNYAGGTLEFDFKGLFDLVLPLNLIVVGEDRDLVANAGVPTLGGSSLFNQQFVTGYFTWGITPVVTFLATAGYEVWASQHSYFPVDIQTKQYGLGADFKLDPYLSGLAINLRGTLMQVSDLYVGTNDFSIESIDLGTTLTY